jgi:ribosomal protein S18 acetylase RimI-like enzyme
VSRAAGTIRQASAADAEAIRTLTRHAYAKWVPLIGREPLPMTVDYAEAVRRDRIDLLEFDGEVAGLVELVAAADHVLIENVAVAPDFQGRGLGRTLIEHAEAVAAALGAATVRLYTNERFVENIRFYQHLGYRIDREEMWPAGTAVFMSKDLGIRRPRTGLR